MSRRVQVTIPEGVEALFNWILKYDPQFKGKEAGIAAHFLEHGLRSAYEESLRNSPGIDADDLGPLAEHARATLDRAG